MNRPLAKPARPKARPSGSDAAGTWARDLCLRVGEEDENGKWKWKRSHIPALGCKATLLALCQYVDEEGRCWPSTAKLADNTDQSWDSVNRRLADLEFLGIIARAPRWRDDAGIVNKDGRGRPTTAEIMLLFDVQQEQIDAQLWNRVIAAEEASGKAKDAPDGETSDVSETIDDTQEVAGSVADCDPKSEASGRSVATMESQSCDPQVNPSLNQDPLQKVSPQTEIESEGQAGKQLEGQSAKQAATEPIGFDAMWSKYPGHATMDRDRALRAFIALAQSDRDLAGTAVNFYASDCTKFRRTPISCERWLKARRFANYGAGSATPEARTFIVNGTEQFEAWCNFYAVASGGIPKLPSFVAANNDRGERGGWVPAAWPLGGEGWLVPFDRWLFVEEGTPQYKRYVERVFEITNRTPLNQFSDALRSRGRQLISKDGTGWSSREVKGLLVPREWPPAKGSQTISGTLMTEADETELINTS